MCSFAKLQLLFVSVCRDLIGTLRSAADRKHYAWVFDAVFPKYFPILALAAERWAEVPTVANTVLKLMEELVTNNSGRVAFDTLSPNGVLLFKEASNLLVTIGTRVLAQPITSRDVLPQRYKCLAAALRMITKALEGNFVNLGVFPLYGDKCLEKALQVSVRIVTSVPLNDLLAFPKLSVAYFTFLLVAIRSHTICIAALPPSQFNGVMASLEDGLGSPNAQVANTCAVAVDVFASDYVANSCKETPTAQALRTQVTRNPGMFSGLLSTIFQLCVFDDTHDLWTLNRALLPVIVAADSSRPESFERFRQELVQRQNPDVQSKLVECFDQLMVDVTKSLDAASRDRFSVQLAAFLSNARPLLRV